MSKPQLLTSQEYLQDLTVLVDNASKHIYGLTLIITDDAVTHDLILALEKAAKRGVRVTIAIDAFTYSELGGYFSPLKYKKAASVATLSMAKRLKHAGVHFTTLSNSSKINPFSGVTHIKWFVVDDSVYCFGGTNLYAKGIKHSDYMFKIVDSTLAQKIIAQQQLILEADSKNAPYRGYSSETPYGILLVDSGKKHQSIIYDRACSLAMEAKEIIYVSQYCPSGVLAKHIKNTDTKMYFNRPDLANFYNGLLIRSTILRTKLKTRYKKDIYIHAKFIIFTMHNGDKIALTGSHNFAYSGVALGTKEVALETKNHAIIKQLEQFFQDKIV